MSAGSTLLLLRGNRAPINPLVRAFANTTGASDLTGLSNLIDYVEDEGILGNFVMYPMKAAQNYGTGSVVAPLGGLTTNVLNLVAGPSWGTPGITFNGSTQYGTINDFIGAQELFVFTRLQHASAAPTADHCLASQYNAAANRRSWFLSQSGTIAGDPYRIVKSADGLSGEAYDSTGETNTTADQTIVARWASGTGRNIWQNKTALTLVLMGGVNQTARFNSPDPVVVGGILSGGLIQAFDGVITTSVFYIGSLTATRRETITDLINAL